MRAPSSFAFCDRVLMRGLFLVGTTLTLILGCGSRGPLDDSPFERQPDAAVDATVVDAAAEADAGPKLSGIAGCGVCILSTCSDTITTCAEQPQCLAILECIGTTCLAPLVSGGDAGRRGVDTACLLGCAHDPQGIIQAFAILQCVTGKCGSDCTSVLSGGLGGLGGSSGRDAGR